MPTNIATFQAPNLLFLSLTSHNASIAHLLVNSSLPFPTLRELRLAWSSTSTEYLALTEQILLRGTGLTRIEGDHNALVTIARALWRKKGEMGSYVEKMAGTAVTYRNTYSNTQFALYRPDKEEDLMVLIYRLGLAEPQTPREDVLRWLDAYFM
jgi:hypothetical protein